MRNLHKGFVTTGNYKWEVNNVENIWHHNKAYTYVNIRCKKLNKEISKNSNSMTV